MDSQRVQTTENKHGAQLVFRRKMCVPPHKVAKRSAYMYSTVNSNAHGNAIECFTCLCFG
jgi:hypothetical protein